MIFRPARVTLILLVPLLLLAGCGGEPDAVTDQDAVLRFKLDEYTIDPQVVRVVAKTIPMEIKIVATNQGRLTHNVTIERMPQEAAQPDASVIVVEPRPIGRTPTAQPGQTVRSDPEQPIMIVPGEYRITDSIGNHDNLGQYGTLIIENEPAP